MVNLKVLKWDREPATCILSSSLISMAVSLMTHFIGLTSDPARLTRKSMTNLVPRFRMKLGPLDSLSSLSRFFVRHFLLASAICSFWLKYSEGNLTP